MKSKEELLTVKVWLNGRPPSGRPSCTFFNVEEISWNENTVALIMGEVARSFWYHAITSIEVV